MKDFNDYLDNLIEMLPVGETLSDEELIDRSGQFLQGLAHLVNEKRNLDEDIIRTKSLRDVAYAEAFNSAPGTNAQAREANAEADPKYLKARETYEKAEAEHNRLQGLIKVIDHAHVFYRQLKAGNKGMM